MKKSYKLIAASALAIALAIPVMALADDGSVQIDTDTSVNVNASVTAPGQLLPPPQNRDENHGGPGPNGRPSIRAAIRADINSRVENAQNNQDLRNMIERDRMGTDTMDMRPFMGSSTRMMASSTFMASSTLRDRLFQYKDNGHAMRLDGFVIRKHMIARELDVALNNLDNISSRLESRIQKEQAAGHDMTDAISALAAANAKIASASSTIAQLEAYLPEASSTDVTASSTVNLDEARTLTSSAQSAIKDAQRALNDVVTTIAHELGIKLDDDDQGHNMPEEATSTATTTSQ